MKTELIIDMEDVLLDNSIQNEEELHNYLEKLHKTLNDYFVENCDGSKFYDRLNDVLTMLENSKIKYE